MVRAMFDPRGLCRRDFSGSSNVYLWPDAVHFNKDLVSTKVERSLDQSMSMRKERLTVTADPELVQASNEAMAAGQAGSLSGWVNLALADRAIRDGRLRRCRKRSLSTTRSLAR